MSSRALKKLHGESELGVIEQEDDQLLSDVDNTGSDISGTKKKQFNINRYDLLNEQSLSESEVKEDDNETEHASTTAPHPCEQTKKKKKKRKKKSGKQSSAMINRRSSEDNADLDDITRTAREVDKLFGERTPVSTTNDVTPSTSNLVIKALLSVQHKNLNPNNEMKRMFGSKVVQAEQQNKRRNARGTRSIKSTWLVSPNENWPPVSKTGIYMTVEQQHNSNDGNDTNTTSIDDNNRGVIWFKFEHNATYRGLQQKFLSAVESMDSDNIIQIINQQPYHIDSLIQLSELCKMSEDHSMASQLIQHAILALESSFHSMFSLTAGNCRLDYRRQENRAIYIVLFKHAQYLEARACAKTALEVTKLLFSFEPETDPLALILIIDYYALRAKEYQWLIQLYNEWEISKNLAQLPNMAYSYALALFHQHKNGDLKLADESIQYALLMFPGVLKALLNEISVQVDSRVNSHSFFGPQSFSSQSPALQQLTSLYVHRSKIVWRDTDILPWLERNVNVVLDKVDAKDDIVMEYSTKRSQRYQTPPRTILRHIFLSDFKEKVPLAPFINKDSDPIMMCDPIPPLNSINIYNRPNMSPASRDSSSFSMFFQSLSPNFVIPDAGRIVNALPQLPDQIDLVDADGAAAVPNVQSFVDLRNSLSSLSSIVDAMHDFLRNIRVAERPNDADVDENESSDDDDANLT